DAGLLARATVWAATNEEGANQAFNITNGDLFRWNELWPRIARMFELDVAPPLSMSLDVVMADKEPLWNQMVKRHGLAENPYSAVSSWRFGDAVFSWDYDMFGDGSKARRFGFHEFVETEAMFERLFAEYRARKIIPPLSTRP
ncbi:MAG: NAD-dependent dehydratase, partial [Polyangiaceae bacterium]|nr:NAD-dependent dehydratase [Polyangiaceae bacterium]